MKKLLLALSATTLFACGTAPGASTSATAAASAAPVQIVDTAAGKVYADATSGLTLYTYDHDTTSASTCYLACARAWPALLSPATTLAVPFAVSARTDGTKQVVLNGHPLYTYAGDAAKGDILGDGLGGIWHVAKP